MTSPVREGEVSLFPRSIGSLLKAIQYGARSISHPAHPPRSPRGLLACCLLCPQWRWPLTTPRTMLQMLFTIARLPQRPRRGVLTDLMERRTPSSGTLGIRGLVYGRRGRTVVWCGAGAAWLLQSHGMHMRPSGVTTARPRAGTGPCTSLISRISWIRCTLGTTSARMSRLSTTACAFPDGFACQSSCGAGLGGRDVRSVEGEPTGKGVNAAGFSDNLSRGRP